MNNSGGERMMARVLPYVLGLVMLGTMLIPQLALNIYWRLPVRAVLCGALVYLAVRRSPRQGIIFTALVAAVAWVFDIEEGILITLMAVSALGMILIIHRVQTPMVWRVVLGCLCASLIMAAGVCGMLLWHNRSEFIPALQLGLKQEWPTLIAFLVGGCAGLYLAERKK